MAAKEQSLAEHLLASATGHFKWPANAVLLHLPQERELLPDICQRLMFQVYLQLAKLQYKNEVVNNADYMSPNGKSPFLCLHMGAHPLIYSDIEKLISFLDTQSLGFAKMNPQQKADQEAYLSLVRTKLNTALTYQTWANKKNIQTTISTHGYSLCWPLNRVVPRLEQFKYAWNHWDMYWRPHTEVLLDFEQACHCLSQRLGNNELFFEANVSVLDVVVYAHLKACLSTSTELGRIVCQFENLKQFVEVTIPSRDVSC